VLPTVLVESSLDGVEVTSSERKILRTFSLNAQYDSTYYRYLTSSSSPVNLHSQTVFPGLYFPSERGCNISHFRTPSEAVNTWVLGLDKPLCVVVSCYSVTETVNFTVIKYIVPLLLHEVQQISNDPGLGGQISGPLLNGIQCPGEFNLSNILQVKLHCN
jgi:hypothetical protein